VRPNVRHVAAALVLAVLVAGCAGGPGAGTPEASPTEGSTPTESPSPTSTASPTPTPDPVLTGPSGRPAPDQRVTLRNEWNGSVAVTLRVVRVATNETVHEATYDLAPGAEREVYSTAEADPDGVEAFRVVVAARGQTGSVTIETDACYGGAFGTVREDGRLDVFYAVC
jgi:hypothetical protein